MLQYILQPLYFLLPAYFANMAPVIVKNLAKPLARPIDFGMSWKGKRILGDHKTWRGLVFGIVFSVLIAFMQRHLLGTRAGAYLSVIDYTYPALIGFLLGFGAILGDAVKSFFKRRSNHTPGERFFPFDQCDFVLGAILFSLPFWPFTLSQTLLAIVITIFLHIIVNHIAYATGIRDEAW